METLRRIGMSVGLVFELIASSLANLCESEADRDERLQRSELDRLWQRSQKSPSKGQQS